ncbi:hypothetical protein ABBQ38_011356 [Trebouxia sp. C0009 RCD-2024]
MPARPLLEELHSGLWLKQLRQGYANRHAFYGVARALPSCQPFAPTPAQVFRVNSDLVETVLRAGGR